jgi:hypothetical protein
VEVEFYELRFVHECEEAALLLGKQAKKRSPAALEGGFHEGLATAVGHRA